MEELCVWSCVGLDVWLPDLGAVEEMISNAVAWCVCVVVALEALLLAWGPALPGSAQTRSKVIKSCEPVEVADFGEEPSSRVLCLSPWATEASLRLSSAVGQMDAAPHQTGMPCKVLVQNCNKSAVGLLVAANSLSLLIPRSAFSCWRIFCYCFLT